MKMQTIAGNFWPIALRIAAGVCLVATLGVALTPDYAVACVGHPNNQARLNDCGGSGGGGGVVYRGGGGSNAGAAIGAAGMALGVLGTIIENSNGGNGSPSPGGSCRPGFRQTPDGRCMPSGAVDCGNGRYCPSGNVCSNGGCLPRSTAEYWRDQDAKDAQQKVQNEIAAQRELEQIYQGLNSPQQTPVSTGASQAFANANPFASRAQPARAANGPQLFHRLTKQQCSDRGGRIITYTNTAGQGPDVGECFVQASLAGGAVLPRPPTGRVTPDVAREIQAMAGSIMDLPDGASDRPQRIRKLKRLMADHGVPVKPQDMQCLQPINGSDPPFVDVPLRWHPYHIKKEAIDQSHLCDGVQEGDAMDACRETKYGEAVMWAEPELAGQCRTANAPDFNPDAVAECAKQRFLSAWSTNEGIVPASTPATWVMPASCGPKVPKATRKNTLRDRLREALSGPANDNNTNASDDGQPQLAAAAAPVAANPPPPPPSPPAADENEAYCNYMAQAAVRGEWTPGAGTPIPAECKTMVNAALAKRAKLQTEGTRPFSMNGGDTDREVGKLLGPSSPAQNDAKAGAN